MRNLSINALFDNTSSKYHGKTWTCLHKICLKAADRYLRTTNRTFNRVEKYVFAGELDHDGIVWGQLSVQQSLRAHGAGAGAEVVRAAQLAVVVRRREQVVVWRRSDHRI